MQTWQKGRPPSITAKRKAAAELKLQQLEQKAKEEEAVKRKEREEQRKAEQQLVEGVRQRLQEAEARKVQRLAREQAAQEQQRKAAKAAATQDAARYRWGPALSLPSSCTACRKHGLTVTWVGFSSCVIYGYTCL